MTWVISAILMVLALALASHARFHWKAPLILRALEAGTWLYGKELAERAHVGRGTVYVYLERLEDQGLIESREEPPKAHGMLARRVYRITSRGLRALAEDGDFT